MSLKNEIHETNILQVLKDDGVSKTIIEEYENRSTLNLVELKQHMGDDCSWAVRIVYNDFFGGVLIKQYPGEGNRMHYHPDADECWVILEGEWEWYIDGQGRKRVGPHDIVTVKKGTKHQIKCIGNLPGIRFAITRPDVNHTYIKD